MEKATKAPIALLLLLAMFSSELGAMAASWTPASATFYGGGDGSGTMGGACGYGNLYNDGYGVENTALSMALFNNGAACGACFQIVCDWRNSQWCKKGTSITVTATNFCPPNYNLPSNDGGWCNPPREHFDMSQPAWETIAVYSGGIVPVFYQRVRCQRSAGIRFTINGNNYFNLVLITNVGGGGVVSGVWMKGFNTNWMAMSRNWGMNWQSNAYVSGQALSFRVQTDDGNVRTAYNVAPAWWRFGDSYASSVQF